MYNSGYGMAASTAEIAVENMRKQYPGSLQNMTAVYKNLDGPLVTPCSIQDEDAIRMAMTELYGDNQLTGTGLTVTIGTLACATGFQAVGDFARELDNVALFSSENTVELADPYRYPTVITAGSVMMTIFGDMFVALLEKFKWKSVAFIEDQLIDSPKNRMRYKETCRYNREALEKNRTINIQFKQINVNATSVIAWREALTEASQFTRIIMSCTTGKKQKDFLETAVDLGMVSGDYVLIMAYTYVVADDPFFEYDPNNTKLASAIDSVLVIRPFVPDFSGINKIMKTVEERRLQTFNISGTDLEANEFAVTLYESIESISQIFDTYYAAKRNVKISGLDFANYFNNATFNLTSEKITYHNKLRVSELQIKQFNKETLTFDTVYTMNTTHNSTLAPTGKRLKWKLGQAPPDRPRCGLQNDQCKDQTIMYIAIGVAVGAVTLIGLLSVGAVVIIKRQRQRADLLSGWWHIAPTELAEPMASKVPSQAHTQNASNAHSVHNSQFMNLIRPTSQASQNSAADSAHSEQTTVRRPYQWKSLQPHHKVVLRGEEEWMTPMQFQISNAADLSWDCLKFFQKIRNLRHPNMNAFIGVCTEIKQGIVEGYAERGSLADLMASEKPVDKDMKVSLMIDLVQGLVFLHNSVLGSHGDLRSTKCVIDKVFSLKIADCANEPIKRYFRAVDLNMMKNPLDQLWTSPEVLRSLASPQTTTNDMYSFAIILFEILRQVGPFCLGHPARLSEKQAAEVVDRVRQVSTIPFRPDLSTWERGPFVNQMIVLLEGCWQEDVEKRFTIGKVKKLMAAMLDLRSLESAGSLFDRVIRRLTAYHQELEQLAAERTHQYMVERDKCDMVLREMFPVEILQQLRAGITVNAEMFESCTVFFSGISGLEVYLQNDSVAEFIELLDKIYSQFDAALLKHQVYKVETIGASYMIVSGIPVRNGIKHCAEVCSVAIKFQNIFNKIRANDAIKLRIGMHSGPAAAGVVGIKRPRYCLFGDTVNMASRMESHGSAGQTHLSEAAAQIAQKFGFIVNSRGPMLIKGKGEQNTYFLEGRA
ncbi:atrial natriuretic peptide receptor 1-like [Paramacrobiotus metropolitanus]|uniref:atrial natriuretic peptide receptor 1-like n=1 Tax=Paramacrobiotus metropolitanus TaxID=2943436 RepID=UPI002445EF83|nr:atrial natriuretic peptide receptor 1-like [Paramacrobiotus metropolitanus]